MLNATPSTLNHFCGGVNCPEKRRTALAESHRIAGKQSSLEKVQNVYFGGSKRQGGFEPLRKINASHPN